MSQNIYDDPEFFAEYDRMRTEQSGLNEALEQPAFRSLLPDVTGLRVLDMGCGAGELSRWLAEAGAASVVGVDISERMLEKAMAQPHPQVEFKRSAAETLEFTAASFDLVVSSLMFHYIDDLRSVFVRIRQWMGDGGMLVFSMEHPIRTSGQGLPGVGWVKDESGANAAWMIGRYAYEGERVLTWFTDGVVKYHRMVSTIINWLIEAGFGVCRVLEPHGTEEEEQLRPRLVSERIRPSLLFVAAEAR